MTSVIDLRVLVAALAVTALVLAFAAPFASAQSYSDVPSGHWARSAIRWVTDQGPFDPRVLDDYGTRFRPERAITRAQLARALVVISGHQDDPVPKPVPLPDIVPELNPYYWDIQVALQLGLMSANGGGFHPDNTVAAWKAEAAVVRLVRLLHPDDDFAMLSALKPVNWRPNEGWRTKAPSYLASVVASRHLLLRFNHPSGSDAQEVSPAEPIGRAEVAYMLREAMTLNEWEVDGLAGYKTITFPPLSAQQRRVADFALKYVGWPYVWAGEWPAKDSPYGRQAHGGFDCSGFVWWVMKIRFGYPISVNERGASDMARRAKPRIVRSKLKCGDLMFFGPNGPSSSAGSIYHAALYLGRGWFIHSTGSADGVTLASLDRSSYWRQHFAWGRRVMKASELVIE
jgi:hypothetical protein